HRDRSQDQNSTPSGSRFVSSRVQRHRETTAWHRAAQRRTLSFTESSSLADIWPRVDVGEIMHLRTLLAISVVLCCNAAIAGLKEGYEALSRTDYAIARGVVG